jgi:hypothetical protein
MALKKKKSRPVNGAASGFILFMNQLRSKTEPVPTWIAYQPLKPNPLRRISDRIGAIKC